MYRDHLENLNLYTYIKHTLKSQISPWDQSKEVVIGRSLTYKKSFGGHFLTKQGNGNQLQTKNSFMKI